MQDGTSIGFIGLGVMGEAMCRNLALKSGRPVIGLDKNPAPLSRLAVDGVTTADTVAGLAQACSVIFLALPSGQFLAEVCTGADGLLAHARPGAMIVDLGTSPVSLTRELATAFTARQVEYADAPIARTRQAAETGTLSIMVGAQRRITPCCAPYWHSSRQTSRIVARWAPARSSRS